MRITPLIKGAMVITLGLSLQACANKPLLASAEVGASYFCGDFDPHSHVFSAELLDSKGSLIAFESDEIDVRLSPSKFSTGFCDLTVTFVSFPISNAPFKVKFFVDGKPISRTETTLEESDLTIYER